MKNDVQEQELQIIEKSEKNESIIDVEKNEEIDKESNNTVNKEDLLKNKIIVQPDSQNNDVNQVTL